MKFVMATKYSSLPFLHGVGSLGNISGGHSHLHLSLRGSHVQDMRNDWLMVGDAFRESLSSYKI